MDNTLATRLAFVTSLAVMISTMNSGAMAPKVWGMLTCGGTLAAHLQGIVLRMFFALLMMVMAVRMVWHIQSCEVCAPAGLLRIYLAGGFHIGIISSTMGIGGGPWGCW
ncbi:MAG: hypothetical protein WCF90_04575 [Methanomicrobiales archaeon]